MKLLYVLAIVGLMAVAANGDIFSLPAIPIVSRRAPLTTHCIITRVRRDCGYSFNDKEGRWESNCPSKFDIREELEDFVVGTGEKKH